MIEIRVRFKRNADDILGGDTQVKRFKDDMSCMEWVRKNHEKIISINGNLTYGQQVGHFDLMRLIEEDQNDTW